MKNIPLLLMIILLNYALILCGQENDYGAILPPSPEASSLAKFTEIPINHYTGLPHISIPLYSFDMDGQDIEIGLSYHARGVPVGEIASRVGIGWTLKAGGAITRQTRGKPDDGTFGYLQGDFYTNFTTNSNVRQSVYNALLADNIDIEPDRFSFSFLGFSGKFYFDQRSPGKKIVMEQYSDLKIEPIFQMNYYKILGWIITTPDGFKYYFGQPRNSSQTSRVSRDIDLTENFKAKLGNHFAFDVEPPSTYNTWQLIDIVSPTGKEINFDYEKETVVFCRKNYDVVEEEKLDEFKLFSYFSKITSTQHQLKTISFDGGAINFIKETKSRQDLQSAYALQYIEVKDSQNTLVKKYRFDYSYSHDNSTKNVLPQLSTFDPYAAYRLFLNSVTELAENTELPPYEFIYTDKNQLPNRFTTSMDYWGFYNGKDNGYFLNYTNDGENPDDKRVDPLKAKTGLLSRVVYPTGGYASYDFEANKALPPSYFNDLDFNGVNPLESKSAGLFKNHLERVSNGVYESAEFTVGHPVSVYVTASFTTWGSHRFQAQIVNLAGSVVQNIPLGSNNNIISNFTNTGIYKIRVKTQDYDDPYDLTNSFSVVLSWNESIPQTELIYSGGNRIRKIVLNNANGETVEKEYTYVDENGESSGRVYSMPCYNFVSTFINGGITLSGVLKPGTPLTYNQGNHMGYSCVTEYLSGNSGYSGKTEYFYTNMYDQGSFWTWPFTVPDDNEELRGKIVRTNYYNYNSDLDFFNIVRRTNYSYIAYGSKLYTYNNPQEIPSTYISYTVDKVKFRVPLIIFTAGDGPHYNSYTEYYLRGGTMQLNSVEKTDYDKGVFQNPDENTTITSKEIYTYDNLNNYQMVQSKTSGSDGKIITKKYFYPSNYGAYFNTLKGKNIIVPVDIRTYSENQLISGQQTSYNENGQPVDLYVAEIEPGVSDIPFNASNPFTFKYKGNYLYNSKGKIKQVSLDNNTTIAYLWDFTGTCLMAKVEGATYSQVSMQDGKPMSFSSSALYVDLKNLVPDAQITTYSHKPLIGIHATTGLNGVTSYYEYDVFGRLIKIKDTGGKIIEQYDYHYKP